MDTTMSMLPAYIIWASYMWKDITIQAKCNKQLQTNLLDFGVHFVMINQGNVHCICISFVGYPKQSHRKP